MCSASRPLPGAGEPSHQEGGIPLVFVGACTLDNIALVDTFPAADSRTVATDLVTAGGGPAATAAVAAARAGVSSAFIGSVGADEEGEIILAHLEREGVDVSGVTTCAGQRSGASMVIAAVAGHTRAIVTRPVPALDVNHRRALELLRAAKWVHVDHLGWPALHALAPSSGPDFGFRLSIDGGNHIPGFHLRDADLYVPTLTRLMRGSARDPETIRGTLQAAVSEGAATVIATDGANGAWTLDAKEHLIHVPAHPSVTIRSTLGAGDVFHGALLTAIAAGYGMVEAIEYAHATAAESCAALDGRSAIPRRHLPYRPAPGAELHLPGAHS